jgi:pyrimidine-nucleoside phosphorylase
LFEKAAITEPIVSEQEGYISHIECDEIGICSLILGGGRETKESEIDLSVGLVLEKKKGDYVKCGDVLAYLHANDADKARVARERFLKAYHIASEKPAENVMIKKIIQ